MAAIKLEKLRFKRGYVAEMTVILLSIADWTYGWWEKTEQAREERKAAEQISADQKVVHAIQSNKLRCQ